MTVLLIAAALLGVILGRLFKVYVLIPTCFLTLIVALEGPTFGYESLTYSFLEMVLIATSIQIGYFVGLASRNLVIGVSRHRSVTPRPHPVSSRSLHLR